MSERAPASGLAPAQPPPRDRLDLNLLPARHRRQPPSIANLLSWVLLLALLAMLLPSWQWFERQATDYRSVVAQAEQVAEAVRAASAQDDLDARATEGAALEARAVELESALNGLGIRTLAWGEVLPLILERTPAGISYTEITDGEGTVVLDGVAPDEVVPLVLVRNLTDLGLFAAVRLEALDRLAVEEVTPTPTATPRPRTTPTPTPEPTSEPPRFRFTLTLVIGGGAP